MLEVIEGHSDNASKYQKDGNQDPWKRDPDVPLSVLRVFWIEFVRHCDTPHEIFNLTLRVVCWRLQWLGFFPEEDTSY